MTLGRLVLMCAFLLCAACRDAGAERWARGKAAYDQLINQGAQPRAGGFDQVLDDLRAVPPGHARAAEADRLIRAIEGARAAPVRTPLALNPAGGTRPEELEAQLRACARLAELAGRDGGVEKRLIEALESCRRKAEEIDVRLAHCDEGHDGGQ